MRFPFKRTGKLKGLGVALTGDVPHRELIHGMTLGPGESAGVPFDLGAVDAEAFKVLVLELVSKGALKVEVTQGPIEQVAAYSFRRECSVLIGGAKFAALSLSWDSKADAQKDTAYADS